MSVEITQSPYATVGGETSKWNAAGNPIVYKLQRKDLVFNQVNNNGGFVQLQFNSIDYTSLFANDDELYVKSDNSVYDTLATQTAEAFSGGNTLITTDIPYTSAAPGGFVNNETFKRFFRLEINVYRYEGSYSDLTNELLGSANYSPTSTGYISADIAEIIKAQLSFEISANLTSTTEFFGDTNIRIPFFIRYREVYAGSNESDQADENTYYASLSSKQIPSTYGGNMGDYVCFSGGAIKAKFLTKLDKPVMWTGYPFLVETIIEEDMGSSVYFVAGADMTTNISANGNALLFDLNQIITDQTQEEVEITVYENDSPDVSVTETLDIELREPCINPIMLVGRNTLGGPIQWLFEANQEYTFDYGNDIKAKRLVLSAAGLTINQWEALQDFIGLGEIYRENIVELTSSTYKTSSKIGQQLYVIDTNGNKIGVVSIPTRNRTQTKLNQHYFEIEIEYPEVL